MNIQIKSIYSLFTLIMIAGFLPAQQGYAEPMETIKSFITDKGIDKSDKNWRVKLPKFPTVEFADDKTYFWDLKTNKGKIRIKFLHKVAPNHVANYLYLTELGFFDGLSFHRVISGFMAQGGDPLGNGRGGPGYKFSGEYDRNTLHDKPGILSMANAGPGTDGSQFFITFLPTPHLDGKHTVFGEVVEGLDTVKVLEAAGSRSGAPSEPLSIETAKITVE
jgi:peptidyl-prolyl cis-trans isomerase B (cyclophilin B)